MVQLNECLCDWQEQPSTGTVKGYTLVTECEPCKARREQANADKELADAEALRVKEVEDLIEAKKREIAIAELQAEEKLDVDCKLTESYMGSLKPKPIEEPVPVEEPKPVDEETVP